MSRIEELERYTKKELIDRIIELESSWGKELSESIKKGIKDGLDKPTSYAYGVCADTVPGSIGVHDWSIDMRTEITSKFENFKSLASQSEKLNKRISELINDEFVLPDFISGNDERYNTEKLSLLDPFNVSEEDVKKTEKILERVQLLRQAFKRGKDTYEIEGEVKGFNDACDRLSEFIENSSLKRHVKVQLGIILDMVRRGAKVC